MDIQSPFDVIGRMNKQSDKENEAQQLLDSAEEVKTPEQIAEAASKKAADDKENGAEAASGEETILDNAEDIAEDIAEEAAESDKTDETVLDNAEENSEEDSSEAAESESDSADETVLDNASENTPAGEGAEEASTEEGNEEVVTDSVSTESDDSEASEEEADLTLDSASEENIDNNNEEQDEATGPADGTDATQVLDDASSEADAGADTGSDEAGAAEGAEDADQVLDAADAIDHDLIDFSNKQIRSMAIATILEWIADGDFTHDSLETLLSGAADVDGDGKISDEEEIMLEDMQLAAIDALEFLGADPEAIEKCFNSEDDECANEIGEKISEKLNNNDLGDEEIIVSFALQTPMFTDRFEIKFKNGKKIKVKKKLRKKRPNPKKLAALKKARRKANSSAAKMKRAKSMRARKAVMR